MPHSRRFWAFVTLASALPALAQEPDGEIKLWESIRQALQASNGQEYFETSLKGALIPALRAKVVSSRAPGHPKSWIVAVSPSDVPDVTLNLIADSPPGPLSSSPRFLPTERNSSPGERRDVDVIQMIRDWRARALEWAASPAAREPVRENVQPPVQPVPQRTAFDNVDTLAGTVIVFQGIPVSFSREPFMLTFDVELSKIAIVLPRK